MPVRAFLMHDSTINSCSVKHTTYFHTARWTLKIHALFAVQRNSSYSETKRINTKIREIWLALLETACSYTDAKILINTPTDVTEQSEKFNLPKLSLRTSELSICFINK